MVDPIYVKGGAIVLGIGCIVAGYFLSSDVTASVALYGMAATLFAWVKTAPGDIPGPAKPTGNIDGSAGSE